MSGFCSLKHLWGSRVPFSGVDQGGPHDAQNHLCYGYHTPWTLDTASSTGQLCWSLASFLSHLQFILYKAARVIFKKYKSYYISPPVASHYRWMNWSHSPRPCPSCVPGIPTLVPLHLVPFPLPGILCPRDTSFFLCQVSDQMLFFQKRGLFLTTSPQEPAS